MPALVNTPNGSAPVELRQIAEPVPAPNEALPDIRAFSLNRGELSSFVRNKEGWVPGQDVAGVVLRQAANGDGPPTGSRVVALMDEHGWAERGAVPSHRMTILPASVSVSRAAALPVAGLIALRTLRHGGPLIAEGLLKPQSGEERSWRDFLTVAGLLRDRRVAGKAILRVEA